MASDATLQFNDADFESQVLQSDQPVLVDFWAEWCQPCKMLGPTIDEIAQEYQGKAKVGKLNIDENRAVPAQFQISAIPTVIVFQNGEPVSKIAGFKPKEVFTEAIDKALAGASA